MTNKDQCGIVRDLLPLVIDDVSSDATRKLVEAHLTECSECKRVMDDMRTEIRHEKIDESDEKFIQLCYKVRRVLSWRRMIMTFVMLVVAVGLLAGGVAYARYKMYVDYQEYVPQQYKVSVNDDGLLVFEYASEGRHGYNGYGFGFGLGDDAGVFYLTPHISAWPQMFAPVEANTVDTFNFIRFQDGKLMHIESTTTDELVFDEITGNRRWKKILNATEITQLRIGTPMDYHVAYRPGDILPVIHSK